MNEIPLPVVAVTGSEGAVGNALREYLPDQYPAQWRYFTWQPSTKFSSTSLDLADTRKTMTAFQGINKVIHLAANPHPDAPWEKILRNNVLTTFNVLTSCVINGIDLVGYASSNHLTHGYVIGALPGMLDVAKAAQYREVPLTTTVRPKPDSPYAYSKLIGEQVGKWYSKCFGITFVALRIGWMPQIPGGNPWDETKNLDQATQDYMQAVFVSRRDCANAFFCALNYKTRGGSVVVNVTSKNKMGIYDMNETKEKLGYVPTDSVEHYFPQNQIVYQHTE